jgi:ankyrin repeat protein
MRAAMSDDNNNFLKWLIENGANVNQKDSDNWTALHFSCEYKCKRNIESLIQSGASVNEKNSTGATPLLRLLAQDTPENFELAKILIINGADPCLQNNAGVSPKDINPDLINSLMNN